MEQQLGVQKCMAVDYWVIAEYSMAVLAEQKALPAAIRGPGLALRKAISVNDRVTSRPADAQSS